jgi:retron-type reverse transcriptase
VGLGDDNYNNINNVNANNQFNNNGRARGIAQSQNLGLGTPFLMKTYKHLFERLISIENLEKAYWKARKHKSNNPTVHEFEKHWQLHLATLHRELKTRTYTPRPLKTFILRDPKTRKICVSDFRDRVVHHALVNILQPIFEPRFIHDSYASRKGKGTFAALKRFNVFLRKVTKNGQLVPDSQNANAVRGYALKADIKHYFDMVDHDVLLSIIAKRVKDDCVLRLVRVILGNYDSESPGKGMPLGNWTSQFFANVYLNELDQFVKHTLKAKYYLRYVDDFVLLHRSKDTLQEYERCVKEFLQKLKLELHPNKCQIIPLRRGITFLGFRLFYRYKLLRQRNIRKIWKKLKEMFEEYGVRNIEASEILNTLQGWQAYAQQGNTYRLREQIASTVMTKLEAQTVLRKGPHAKNFVPSNSV